MRRRKWRRRVFSPGRQGSIVSSRIKKWVRAAHAFGSVRTALSLLRRSRAATDGDRRACAAIRPLKNAISSIYSKGLSYRRHPARIRPAALFRLTDEIA
ncbi:hypothetical protein BURCENK562V_C1148 [Burkholderia cenocepacia K56-2Valvano]|nr:hypothetical protein BURCENK562V_C1148 [Burkholderia cenocepacia K56-2Valvano]